MSEFASWIGREQTMTDVLDPARSNALDVALGGAGSLTAGDPLPLLHHWLYFWDVKPPAGLGADGHPAKGRFLPPIPLPRRMWAGGRLSFHQPLVLGSRVTRTSTITAITQKTGRTGALVFVTVRHELDGGAGGPRPPASDLADAAGVRQPRRAGHRHRVSRPATRFRWYPAACLRRAHGGWYRSLDPARRSEEHDRDGTDQGIGLSQLAAVPPTEQLTIDGQWQDDERGSACRNCWIERARPSRAGK